MAFINITIDDDNSVGVSLDQNEWTGLTVNGTEAQKNTTGSIQFQVCGQNVPVNFEATASDQIQILDSKYDLKINRPGGDQTFICKMHFFKVDDQILLIGKVDLDDGVLPGSVEKEQGFSEGRMTGIFQFSSCPA